MKNLILFIGILFIIGCSTSLQHSRKGWGLVHEEKYDLAIIEFETAFKYGNLPSTYFGLFRAYIGKGNGDSAIQVLSKGLENYPKDKWLLLTAGHVSMEQERYEDALMFYKKAQKTEFGRLTNSMRKPLKKMIQDTEEALRKKESNITKNIPPDETDDTVDTVIRNDGLPMDVQFAAAAYGNALGGIKRWEKNKSKHYQNNIFRFHISLPENWQYFSIQDYNLTNCVINISTPNLVDKNGDTITNAIYLIANTIDSMSQGIEEDYNRLLNGMRDNSKNFKSTIIKDSDNLFYKKLEYSLKHKEDEFKGELLIIQSGNFVYTLNFNSTPDTFKKGNLFFKEFLKSAKWNYCTNE